MHILSMWWRPYFLPINYTVHFWVYLQGRGRNNKFDPLHPWYLFRLVENNYTCRLSKRKKERRSKVSSAEQYICKKNLILIFENALTFAKHERKCISGGGIVVVLGAEGSFLGLSVLPLRFLRLYQAYRNSSFWWRYFPDRNPEKDSKNPD
jgi:hypothetical protein